MPDVIGGIIHTVNQQSRWGVGTDLDPRRKREALLGTGLIPQMPRVEQDREVRTGRLTIGRVYGFVNALLGVAHRRGKVPAGRKADDAYLLGVDSVRRGAV